MEELGDSGIKVVGKIMADGIVIGRQDIVEELSHSDIVVGKVLGHCDSILTVEELSHRDIVLGKELVNNVVKELGNRDIISI